MDIAVRASQLSIVYLLTNPAMPGLVKIGRTTHEEAKTRLGQLYSTGVPVPFELVFACKVPNPEEVESALHEAFAPHRVNPKREFFRIEPDQAVAILKLLHTEVSTDSRDFQQADISPEEIAATENLRRRRPNLNFTEMGIPPGAVLTCSDNDLTVTVTGPRKVRLGDDDMSLTAATRVALDLDYSVAPAGYWTFEGRPLREIYDETYN